jgi:hypothetical protein
VKQINTLGITSVTLSTLGALGYAATFFLWTRSGGHYTPSSVLLPMASIFCSIVGVVAGALGLRPVRALNLIGFIIGALLLMIVFIGLILVVFFGL